MHRLFIYIFIYLLVHIIYFIFTILPINHKEDIFQLNLINSI